VTKAHAINYYSVRANKDFNRIKAWKRGFCYGIMLVIEVLLAVDMHKHNNIDLQYF
jgi:hypothetical protein